ncbi:mucin-6-like isoform X2 [Schistocerca cancellata]|uniref:mucin-6-like isoform X2 n=1 Tax=Schistocerca cancellata TaxID=274614 RepID=UPI002117B07A|nr:mucin-6-like isoform X2 [Schistocerca cancellata]
MGESVKELLQFLCRLCARTDKSCVDVFSKDGSRHFIQKKIRLCLPVIVEEQDEMPRQICLSCLNKLESTYEFYTTCIYAQSTIQRLLRAESLQDSDHVNELGNKTEEQIPASFSLDQYLKRKIDPVDNGKSTKVPRTDKLEKNLRNNNVFLETTKAPDSEVSTVRANSKDSIVTTNNTELQCASTAVGKSNASVATTKNSEFLCATSTNPQKPKLRVKTTSELRQAGQTSTVKDCVPALLPLQKSSSQSASIPTTGQSTCVSASPSTSVVFSQTAVPQSCHSTASVPQQVKSSLPQHVSNSSASQGGMSWSPAVQNTKCVPSAPQCIGSSSSVLQFSTSSSPVLQTATSSLSVPQNATALLPVSNNATVSLPLPENATASLTVPQNVTNSSSLQQYSLSVPNSLSSGQAILPNVSQFIIVPDTFASAPTFTAAGMSTVTVLTPAVPSNVSLVGDLGIQLGPATTLVAPQTTQPSLPVSVGALTVSTTPAVPLASSSLPLVQTVPIQLAQELPNSVVSTLTSAPAIISQSSTSDSVSYSVLKRNSQTLVISSNSLATVTTSSANVSSKANHQPSVLPQNLKVLSSSSVSPAGNVPVMRVSTESKIVRLQNDTVVRGVGNDASSVLSKQNGSAQLKKNVTASSAVSHPNILLKRTSPAAISAKQFTSNSSPVLIGRLTCSVPNSKKSSSVPPGKTSDAESTSKTKTLLGIVTQGSKSQHPDSNKALQKTVLCYSNRSATKVNSSTPNKTTTVPTPNSVSQATVSTAVPSSQPTFSGSIGSTHKRKEDVRPGILKKINSKSAGNAQLPVVDTVTNMKAEQQPSENRPQQKAAVLRSQPSGELPPPPPAVPLNSISISDNRRILTNTGSGDLQNCEAKSASQANKSGLTPKPRGAVVTATVSPFTPTLRPASEPQRQLPDGSPPEVQVEPVRPSSQSPSEAGPGRSSTSSPSAPSVGKEECPYCHIEFPVDILIHHKTLHYRERFYTCIDCDKNFVTEKGLESHRCQKESKG